MVHSAAPFSLATGNWQLGTRHTDREPLPGSDPDPSPPSRHRVSQKKGRKPQKTSREAAKAAQQASHDLDGSSTTSPDLCRVPDDATFHDPALSYLVTSLVNLRRVRENLRPVPDRQDEEGIRGKGLPQTESQLGKASCLSGRWARFTSGLGGGKTAQAKSGFRGRPGSEQGMPPGNQGIL